MKITVTNKIIIEDAPKEVAKVIKKTLTLPNPMYFKMMRMGNVAAIYGLPESFKYFATLGNKLFVGRGFENRLINFLNKNNYEYEYRDITADTTFKDEFNTTIRLRPYQCGDTDVIRSNTNGVIRLGTGYGKTIIAVKLIEELQVSTCIIVPRTHLVQQFQDTIRTYTNIKNPGIIQGPSWNYNKITIASIQTLVRRPEKTLDIKDKFGMIIVDECHTAITNKRLNVIQMFNPKYLYGMTATARRTDQQDKAIFFTFGDIIIDKDMERKAPEVELLISPIMIPISHEYHEMVGEQIKNKYRNDLIIKSIREELLEKRKILVLTKRIAHYQKLASEFTNVKTYSIESSQNNNERSRMLKKLREGRKDFDIIFGTYSMLSTGTDIPALDTLVFAGDLRSDVLQEQSAGRILRIFGNKRDPKIIDVIDVKNPIFNHQANARLKWYRKQKWIQ